MMRLFIRLQNGQPFEHPIMEDNFRSAFPQINVDNLPPEFAEFERVPKPDLRVYEVYDGVTYELVDGVFKDVHHVREMTQAEKTAKQNEVKEFWAINGHASWLFNEETCRFDPPVPYPVGMGRHRWDEETTSWVPVT